MLQTIIQQVSNVTALTFRIGCIVGAEVEELVDRKLVLISKAVARRGGCPDWGALHAVLVYAYASFHRMLGAYVCLSAETPMSFVHPTMQLVSAIATVIHPFMMMQEKKREAARSA